MRRIVSPIFSIIVKGKTFQVDLAETGTGAFVVFGLLSRKQLPAVVHDQFTPVICDDVNGGASD
jgi:hypothetical protein